MPRYPSNCSIVFFHVPDMFSFWGNMVLSDLLGSLPSACYLKPHLVHLLVAFHLFLRWLKLSIPCPLPLAQLPSTYACQLLALQVIRISRHLSYLFNAPCYWVPEKGMSIGKSKHCNSVVCKWEVIYYCVLISHFLTSFISNIEHWHSNPSKYLLCKGHSGHIASWVTPT